MTTPNIDGLIDRLYDWHNTSAEQNRLDMQKAADLLQSQAERIAELEVIVASYGELDVEQAKHIACMESDLDTLRAELAALAATEPVAWMSPGKERLEFSRKDTVYGSHTIALFTRPMPAQDVAELVEALEKLARLGNGEHYGNSDGNMIAREALSKYKGAK